jgi:IS605 OrfB family transposase
MPKVTVPDTGKVCAVDLGINTTAVCSIVHSDGTVSARLFIDRKADIDHRDKTLYSIRRKASQTMGKSGKLSPGFCSGLYRRAANLNLDIGRRVSKAIVDFAVGHGTQAVVFENLKGWRPKAGRKGSTLRQRFHGWLHRRIFNGASMKLMELGIKVETIYARGTSSLAYDGSGPVKRDKDNRAISRFSSGKVYDADLSASYNIGARYWAPRLSPAGRNASRSARGRSSSTEPGTPVTLSTLWRHAGEQELEAAPKAALAA